MEGSSKTCVFITGTNCTGKTSLARALIENIGGGVKSQTKELTICNNEKIAFVGRYVGCAYGGVDGLSETKSLMRIISEALGKASIVFAEGVYMKTFGGNLQRALFLADNRFVFFLYADTYTINKRLKERGGSNITRSILDDQRTAYRSAMRWRSVGVNVTPIDTSNTTIEQEIQIIKNKLNGIL